MQQQTSPHPAKHWTIDVSVDEHDGRTKAKVRLHWGDREWVGVGLARCNPADRDIADIGDELAVALALSDLSGCLLGATRHHIEAATREPVSELH